MTCSRYGGKENRKETNMGLFKMVEVKDGVVCQYLGVYVLRWRPEWGKPTVAFVEVDDTEQAVVDTPLKEDNAE